ncbi:MAG: hypothetical protein EXR69_12005 [Myxococcales bacterium]|nr:hypothetical protein [Myxococcales bacterium]
MDRDCVSGLVMVEGLAQAWACLGRLGGEQGDAALLGLEAVSFPRPVRAPCTLRFEVTVTAHMARVTEARGVVREVRSASLPERLPEDQDHDVACRAMLRAALL